MLSIFSRAYWPSVCHLNVYLSLLSLFLLSRLEGFLKYIQSNVYLALIKLK